MAKYNLENLQDIVKIEPDEITDIFGENKGNNINFEEELEKRGGKYIVDVEVKRLKDNPNNKFHKIDGEKWEVFVASIKEYGIMQPIIVRPVGRENRLDTLEIIAGHNRVRAAKEVGLDRVPAIISDADDVDASVIIGITNNQRENTTDLEWGWAYRNTYETIKKPSGERTDLTSPLSGDRSIHLTTEQLVAKKYGVGKNTIYRKMRLTYLEQQLLQLYESKKITQDIAIELSYLSSVEQINIASLNADGMKLTLDIAKRFRQLSKDGELNIDNIKKIWESEGEQEIKKVRPKKYMIDDILFPKSVKKSERENYIKKALQYIIDNDINV